jgi:hypothetical protein
MSKASKKTCTFVLKRGDRKGKKCGKPCKDGKRCKEHNKNRAKYMKNYNDKKNQESKKKREEDKKQHIIDRIEKIKKGKGRWPNIEKEKKAIDYCYSCIISIERKKFACKKKINPDLQIPISPSMKRMIEEATKEYTNEYNEKKHGNFENYLKLRLDFYQCLPNYYISYVPFKGSATDAAKQLLKYDQEINRIKQKINDKEELIRLCLDLLKTLSKEKVKKITKNIELSDEDSIYSKEDSHDSMDDISLPSEDEIKLKQYQSESSSEDDGLVEISIPDEFELSFN